MLLPPAADLYPHRCSIYRSVETLDATGKPGAPGLAYVASDVLCYFQTGESVKTNAGFVLSEQDNLFTLDILRFPDTVTVTQGDVIKQTTGPEAGVYWLCRGDDKIRSQFGQYLLVRATRIPRKPEWVP